MVPMEQVTRGVEAYLEDEILPKIGGWKKWVAGAAASIAAERAENVYKMLMDHPVIKALELADEEGVDVEEIYKHFLHEAEKQSVTFDAPLIGRITLNAEDVRKMYRCIMD